LLCHAKRNPFFVLSNSLTERVWGSPGGFNALSDPEKLYYALDLFQGEVNNGGFHQFFFNSSGSYYELIESGLVTFDEPQALELLHQAKQVVFPETLVPADTELDVSRCAIVPPASWMRSIDVSTRAPTRSPQNSRPSPATGDYFPP